MKKLKRIITSLVMLLCFLAANGGSEGLVLCLGENGHVSVETPHEKFCNNFSPSFHNTNIKKHKKHCLDFPLSAGSIEKYAPSKSLETVITAPVAAVVSGQLTPQLNRAGPEFFIRPASLKNTSIENLRTVILLI